MKYLLFFLAVVLPNTAFASEFEETLELAKEGNAEAQHTVAGWYSRGTYSPSNITEAIYWYKKAAAKAHIESINNLALLYRFHFRNMAEAIKWYLKGAALEDMHSIKSLAAIYDLGLGNPGIPEDKSEALKWYRRAAIDGDSNSQIRLAEMYYEGEGIPENYLESARWFRKAAIQGKARSQFKLGLMYADGEGLPRDDIRGFMWLSVAKTNGYGLTSGISSDILSAIKERMTNKEIMKAQALAAKCFASDYKDCD